MQLDIAEPADAGPQSTNDESDTPNEIRSSKGKKELDRIAAVISEYAAIGELGEAERMAHELKKQAPDDERSYFQLARLARRRGDIEQALAYTRECLTRSAGNPDAWEMRIQLLRRAERYDVIAEELELVLQSLPVTDKAMRTRLESTWLNALVRVGKPQRALLAHETGEVDLPRDAAHMNLVRQLNGDTEAFVAWCKKHLASHPDAWEVYIELSGVKTRALSDQEVLELRGLLQEQRFLPPRARMLLWTALGKAYEDRKDYTNSFEFYGRANRLHSAINPHDPKDVEQEFAGIKQAFSPQACRGFQSGGFDEAGPIFIVGLPRAGSTLVEQVLASHSKIGGTWELELMRGAARQIALNGKERISRIEEQGLGAFDAPACAMLSSAQRRKIGEQYHSAVKRLAGGTDYFIDKTPRNFSLIGLILSVLPRACIIDVRRHPMANGLAQYRQPLPGGYAYANDLHQTGHFYREYVGLMKHWDRVFPGKVHRIHYEDLVSTPETTIKKLLDYCEVPFEPACLKFHETQRAVFTPSCDQVRQPMYTSSLDTWKECSAFLEPLKRGLGDAFENYRD